MEKKNAWLPALAASLAMLILILDAKTALSGAYDGIWLCLNTVIPSLFPFLFICLILTGLLSSFPLHFLRPLAKSLHLPENGEMIMLMGFLGGYPAGAQSIWQAYTSGALSRDDAHRMLAFCSNAGPAFVFGMGAAILGKVWLCCLLWLVHILSALTVGWMTASASPSTIKPSCLPSMPVTSAVSQSIRIMATVCGWIVLFRIVLAFLQKWLFGLLPKSVAVLLSGFLELSNGCAGLVQIDSLALRFVMFATMLGSGGLCVSMQTAAVLSGSGLSIRPYFLGKAVQGAVSCAASVLLSVLLPGGPAAFPGSVVVIAAVFMAGIIFFSMNGKLRVAFRQKLLYNNPKTFGGSTYEAFPQKN